MTSDPENFKRALHDFQNEVERLDELTAHIKKLTEELSSGERIGELSLRELNCEQVREHVRSILKLTKKTREG